MPHHSEVYWYQESPFVAKAFLFNCRDDDLVRSDSERIAKGSIVVGKNGVHVAEQAVLGIKARQFSAFQPTRRCSWESHELPCMVHPELAQQLLSTKELRHRGCIVAELSSERAIETARTLNVAIVVVDGKSLVNLSVERHAGQAKERRAKLL